MTYDTLERLVDTYLFYSYPHSTFAFQGGEPTLADCHFFEKLVNYSRAMEEMTFGFQCSADQRHADR
jgi:sulfatase maturation enzyme AslB (radical SAM superfamily)